MKFCFLLLFLNLSTHLQAEAERDRLRDGGQEKNPVQDAAIVRALGRVEERLVIKFDIPFPKNLDIDVYRKRPLAIIEVNGSKVCVTRPLVNPYDEPRSVEWTIAPEDFPKAGDDSVDCAVDLDERGDFTRLNLIVDWASDGTGTHLIDRADSETSKEFFERARLTYQFRAKKAKDVTRAELFLAAFEKMAATIQILRKEEALTVPGAGQP